MKLNFEHNSQSIPIELTPSGKSHRVTIGEDVFDVEIIRAENGRLDLRLIRLNDSASAPQAITAYISSDNAKRWVTVNGQTFVLAKSSGGRRSAGGHQHAAGELMAPMPGQIRAVNVREGDAVTKGQTLLLLEAMKMEIKIQAPREGKVSAVLVKVGQTVEKEQPLITLE